MADRPRACLKSNSGARCGWRWAREAKNEGQWPCSELETHDFGPIFIIFPSFRPDFPRVGSCGEVENLLERTFDYRYSGYCIGLLEDQVVKDAQALKKHP